jgi:hypothetical protein
VYIPETHLFRFHDITDVHHVLFMVGGLILLGTAFVLFRSQARAPVSVGPA